MNTIEWIKAAVGLCAKELQEIDKEKEFGYLEQVFLQKSDLEQDTICRTICQQFEKRDAIFIFSQLLFYTQNDKYVEVILDLLQEIDLTWYEGSMIAWQLCRYNIVNMKKRRAFHRKIVAKYEELLQFDYKYCPLNERNRNRIVVVTQQILSLQHSPTRVVLNFIYALKKLGYEILLFICPQDGGIDPALWFQPSAANSNGEFQRCSKKICYKDEIFRTYQISMSEFCAKEYRMMYDIIYEWKPFFVFDCGTGNPVVDAINKFTTLVSMEMSMVCPVSEADILLRLGKMDIEIEQDYLNGITQEQKQLFFREQIPVVVESTIDSLTREELHLPRDKFLIAIVGNRLDTEMTDENLLLMERIASNNEKINFVIIGNVNILAKKISMYEWSSKVHYLGYQSNLIATYKALDLYWNPRRLGGGYSAVMALMAGIPVVTYPNCDVGYNVGEKFIVNNEEKLIQIVDKYVKDSDFCKNQIEFALQRARENGEEKMVDFVKQLIDDIQTFIKQ